MVQKKLTEGVKTKGLKRKHHSEDLIQGVPDYSQGTIFLIGKLGFTLFTIFVSFYPKHRLRVLIRTASPSKYLNNITIFPTKFSILQLKTSLFIAWASFRNEVFLQLSSDPPFWTAKHWCHITTKQKQSFFIPIKLKGIYYNKLLLTVLKFQNISKDTTQKQSKVLDSLLQLQVNLIIMLSTGQPHYNAIFGVHRNRPSYK